MNKDLSQAKDIKETAVLKGLYASKHTMVLDVNQAGREHEKILYNPLASSVHIVNSSVVSILDGIKNKQGIGEADNGLLQFLLNEGYVYPDKSVEDQKERVEYEKYRMRVQDGAFQLILTTTLKCNMSCTYCYQDAAGMNRPQQMMTPEMFENIDEFVDKYTKDRHEKRFYYLLYGGEPLLTGDKDRAIIERVAKECRMFDIPLAAVTNGVNLYEYCDVFKGIKIGELQVTVDGPPEIHNMRKRALDGEGSYERIMRGIERSIEYEFPINFKVVIDRTNIDYVPDLAEIIDEKGWLDLPEDRFKIQLAENAALSCAGKEAERDNYMRPVDILKNLFEKGKSNSSMKKMFRPFCAGVKVLYTAGMPPHPRFGSCDAGVLQLAFGPDGYVYPCMVYLGFPEHSIGSYYPEVAINEKELQRYEDLFIKNTLECEACDLKYSCGGRCIPSVEKLNTAKCPDVKELVQFGFDYYLPMIEEKWLSEEAKGKQQ